MREGLDEFVFTAAEEKIIEKAMAVARPWECDAVSEVKKRIKAFHLGFGDDLCCYCYRDLQGDFSMVIDIEHILPKRHYKALTFDMRNLSVACKRCNMKMKRDNMDFVNRPLTNADVEESAKYKLIHPNIDYRDTHLQRAVLQLNSKKLVKYIPHTDKGTFAYEYFHLNEFEVDSYDAAQGAHQPPPAEAKAVASIRELIKEIS